MKKILFATAMAIVPFLMSGQNLSLSNLSSKDITCIVYAYGTASGLDNCTSLLHTTIVVNAGYLEMISTFDPNLQWKNAGENVVSNVSSYGAPVWALVQYDYQCGFSRSGSKVNNALCDIAQYTKFLSSCNMTTTWTATLGGVVVNFSN